MKEGGSNNSCQSYCSIMDHHGLAARAQAQDALTLHDIAPIWNKRLEKILAGGETPFFSQLVWNIEIAASDTCVVGEAHGFSSLYKNKCQECTKLSRLFATSFKDNSQWDLLQCRQQFVKHWNKEHPNTKNRLAKQGKKSSFLGRFAWLNNHV